MGKIIALSLILAIAGCQTVPRAQYCQIAKPQRPSQATIDAMTDAEVAQALSALEKGEELCGWRP